MAVCPLCSTRPAKRFCPAKAERICAVCCGTKREVEIDCPSDCTFLRSGRSYESEKRPLDPELEAKADRFDQEFFYKYSPLLEALAGEVVSERVQSEWLVDNDVIETFKSLTATMKTLMSGIYYETLPDGPSRQSLYRRLKAFLDRAMEDRETIDRVLKVGEAVEILEFLTLSAQMNSSIRPRSRKYLDWLTSMSPVPKDQTPSGLILP